MTLDNAPIIGLAVTCLTLGPLYWYERRLRKAYSTTHFGVLAPAAIRHALRRTRGLADYVVIDIRKLHTLNEVLGYTEASALVGRLTRILSDVRTQRGRAVDLAGQWGGDEFVYRLALGTGQGFLQRLLAQLDELTATLTPAQRSELARHTGGLVDGLCVAACLVEGASDPWRAIDHGIAVVTRLKAGRVTGERATSGAVGTVVEVSAL